MYVLHIASLFRETCWIRKDLNKLNSEQLGLNVEVEYSTS